MILSGVDADTVMFLGVNGPLVSSPLCRLSRVPDGAGDGDHQTLRDSEHQPTGSSAAVKQPDGRDEDEPGPAGRPQTPAQHLQTGTFTSVKPALQARYTRVTH